ncbi:MAG: HAMP domain-containing histidine kinase [Lachnospiraceae bacterium]|nr:HAMP domain-containing histidine kinase [Lachnospiraceae bacterium]
MIKKLQKKFISITAIALFIMIFLVMAAINCVFFLQTDRQLDIRLDMLFREQNSVRLQGNTPPPGEKEPEQLFPRFEDKLRIRSDGCVVYLDTSGNITEIRQDGAGNYSEEELESIVSELTAESDSDGWYQYYKFRMVSQTDSKNQSVTVIGLINASSSLYSVFTMLLISLCIGLISFLSILLIIVLASKHAVKPIAESYAKQKQFVTDAGHELKTPLTVISANNELARMIYGDSEWFDSIDRQVNKLNHLVRSLITLAKMDEEQKPVFTPFHFSDAVFDTAKSFESLLHSQGKLLTLDIAENITYNGDESKLRQMVSILMDNAVKYCDEKGKVAVKLTGDRQIRLQVINDYADTENFEADKVFERFFRADKARTSDGSYGLGLSIAKSIVELHKGTIRAKVLEHGRIMFEVIL